jgi:hypothetical protein
VTEKLRFTRHTPLVLVPLYKTAGKFPITVLFATSDTETLTTPTLSVASRLNTGVIPTYMVQPLTISDEPSTTIGLVTSGVGV